MPRNQSLTSWYVISDFDKLNEYTTNLWQQSNLEKQLAEMKVVQNNLVTKNRENEIKVTENFNTIDSFKRQVAEITTVLKSRDSSLAKESSARREAEIELEKLQVRVDEVTRSLDAERTKGTENSQLEALRVRTPYLPF